MNETHGEIEEFRLLLLQQTSNHDLKVPKLGEDDYLVIRSLLRPFNNFVANTKQLGAGQNIDLAGIKSLKPLSEAELVRGRCWSKVPNIFSFSGRLSGVILATLCSCLWRVVGLDVTLFERLGAVRA